MAGEEPFTVGIGEDLLDILIERAKIVRSYIYSGLSTRKTGGPD